MKPPIWQPRRLTISEQDRHALLLREKRSDHEQDTNDTTTCPEGF